MIGERVDIDFFENGQFANDQNLLFFPGSFGPVKREPGEEDGLLLLLVLLHFLLDQEEKVAAVGLDVGPSEGNPLDLDLLLFPPLLGLLGQGSLLALHPLVLELGQVLDPQLEGFVVPHRFLRARDQEIEELLFEDQGPPLGLLQLELGHRLLGRAEELAAAYQKGPLPVHHVGDQPHLEDVLVFAEEALEVQLAELRLGVLRYFLVLPPDQVENRVGGAPAQLGVAVPLAAVKALDQLVGMIDPAVLALFGHQGGALLLRLLGSARFPGNVLARLFGFGEVLSPAVEKDLLLLRVREGVFGVFVL